MCGSGEEAGWRQWLLAEQPWRAPLPGSWDARLSRFQRLLLMRCLRPLSLCLLPVSEWAAKPSSGLTPPPRRLLSSLLACR